MMRSKQSAGLLMFRGDPGSLEVLLVHPGGPYFVRKDLGSWTLPKGEYGDDEEPLAAARREFQEETGLRAEGHFLELGEVRQRSGKIVHAWAFAGDCDPSQIVSNECEIEWPPRSKRRVMIPEIDRGAWFSLPEAEAKIREEQRPLLSRLQEQVGRGTAA